MQEEKWEWDRIMTGSFVLWDIFSKESCSLRWKKKDYLCWLLIVDFVSRQSDNIRLWQTKNMFSWQNFG